MGTKFKALKAKGVKTVSVAFCVPQSACQLTLDLSQPLGIFFDDALLVKSIQEGSQASKFSIRQGSQVCSVEGESLKTTKELVAKVQALKAQGVMSVTLEFLPLEPSEEPAAKRQRK